MQHAANILKTGDYNPHFFNYPSLSIYLAAIGMALGFFSDSSHQVAVNLQTLPAFDFPYYPDATMANAPKYMFALIGTLAAFLSGAMAARTYRMPHLLWLVPALLMLSHIFDSQILYLNPNTIGYAFTALCLFQALAAKQSNSLVQSALLPGFWAGMAIASKYNFTPVLLAPVSALLLYPHTHRTGKIIILLFAAMAAFVVAVPYSLLDLPHFLQDVASEINHYATGHDGNEGKPGWPQCLFFLKQMGLEWGGLLCVALLGWGMALIMQWRETITISIFPMGLLALMAMQKVNFMRNLLPLAPWIATYAALGAIYLGTAIIRLPHRKIRYAAAAGMALLLLSATPWPNIGWRVAVPPDSRNELLSWLKKEVPAASTLFVPEELGLYSPANFENHYHLVPYRMLKQNDLEKVLNETGQAYLVLPVLENDSPDNAVSAFRKKYPSFEQRAHFGNTPMWTSVPIPVTQNSTEFFVLEASDKK